MGCSSSVCCLMYYFWKHPTVQLQMLHKLQLSYRAFSMRVTSGERWRAEQLPHFTLLPLVFYSTKDVLVSRSSAISAPLSSAKHKFAAHSCTGWGFLLLQWGGITTMLFCSVPWSVEWLLQKASALHFNTDLLGLFILELASECVLNRVLYALMPVASSAVLFNMSIIRALTGLKLWRCTQEKRHFEILSTFVLPKPNGRYTFAPWWLPWHCIRWEDVTLCHIKVWINYIQIIYTWDSKKKANQ